MWSSLCNSLEDFIYMCPISKHLEVIWLNSLRPGYMCHWTGSLLVQVLACRLLGAKPLPEPVMTYCQLDQGIYYNWILFRFQNFSLNKMPFKMLSAKWWPFHLCLNMLKTEHKEESSHNDHQDVMSHFLQYPDAINCIRWVMIFKQTDSWMDVWTDR